MTSNRFASFCLTVFFIPLAMGQEPTAPGPVPAAAPEAGAVSEQVSTPPADRFARDSYRIDPVICPFKGEIDYEPGTIVCGLLEVPENRENPGSRMIELHFVKLNSRWEREEFQRQRAKEPDPHAEGLADGRREDPVVYLTGGPGASVSYYVNRFKDHTLLDHRDLYILEQRGIGASADFCPFFGTRKPGLDGVATFEDYLARYDRRVVDCAVSAAAAGVDLTGYNTIENARDVKALRRALGFDQWNVWGISYGSILGQAYIREDPEGILAVALDAIMPLNIRAGELYWRVVHYYERDLQLLQAICQRQPECARRYPDIPGRVRAAVHAVSGRPIEVTVTDTELYPDGTARVFQDVAAFLPFTLFYEQDNYPALPGVIYAWADAVERRDESLFRTLAYAISGFFGDGSEGMRNAILCTDGDVEAQVRAFRQDLADYPVLTGAITSAADLARDLARCDALGMPMRDPGDYAAVETDIPSLIIEGEMDPITPPPNAHAIMPGFSNGTYVEFPFAGHGPSRSVPCAGHLLNKFYDQPDTEPDLSCLEDMEEPDLWAPLYTTDIAPRLAERYFEDKKRLALPLAWAGLSKLALLVSFLVLTLAPIGRWMDGRSAPRAGSARALAWWTALVAVAGMAVLGAGFHITAQASELAILFGLVPWARYGAWLGALAGVLGLLTVIAAWRSRGGSGLQRTSFIGFLLTGLSAIAFSAFLWTWGLGPLPG